MFTRGKMVWPDLAREGRWGVTILEKAKQRKEELLQKEEELQLAISKAEKTKKEAQQRLQMGEALKKDITAKQEQLQDCQREYLTKKVEWESRQEAERELMAQIHYREPQKLQERIAELQQRKEKLTQDYQLTKEAWEENERQIAQQSLLLEKLKKQLNTEVVLDFAVLQAEKSKLIADLQAMREREINLRQNWQYNTELYRALQKATEEETRLEKQYQWQSQLAKTLNGTQAGKSKITLETYMQMFYFERVLQRANVRFLKMSNNQYELKRSTSENMRSQSGLDLLVLDHYNNTERPVSTLSGGESFKASLALALGLADEIQEAAGGVSLDTMFIDEGFGSLDAESLNQAINVLYSLVEGNKLIGIISHVDSLRQRIDRQIKVTKKAEHGSEIEFVGC